jgi:hypothetical protein
MKKVVFGGFWKAAVQGAGMSACILRLCKLEPVSFAAALVALVLLFSGCDQGTGGSSPGQTGTVTLTIGFRGITSGGQENYSLQNVLRTVHPETSDVTSLISRYEVTFKPGSGTAIGPVELDPENPRPVTLTVGTYTVTVTAFEDDGANGYTAIAEGVEEDVPVVKGQNTTADILLGPKAGTGTGTLGYDITITTDVESAKIIITPAGGGTVPDISLSTGTNNGTVTLPSGVYTVVVSLTKGIQYVGFPEIVYIYNSLTVDLPQESYTDANFPGRAVVSLLNLEKIFDAPAAGLPPANVIDTTQYLGSIEWKQGNDDFTATAFAVNTVYTAVLTLTPVTGYTFTGVGANAFSYDGATSVTNAAGGNKVTVIFPKTGSQFSGQGSVNLGFPSGNIMITSSATKTNPANMTFSVPEEYTGVAWYIDGNPAAGTANSIEIDPIGFAVSPHTLGVIGTKKGKLYSGCVEFAVWYTDTLWEIFTLINLEDLTEYLALLPANTADEPHLVSLAPFSVSDTVKWEALKTALDTLKNGNAYINLDLRSCTATGNTITGGSNATTAKSSNAFNYITYAPNSTEYLVGLMLPSTVTTIGENAVYFSKSLRKITIPPGVTTIGTNAFKSCESLAGITIPSGVTVIGNNAFDSCSGLSSITIPASVQSIGTSAFSSCNITVVILESVPPSLGATNSLPHNLNKVSPLVPGIYEYVNGSWSKVN